jgi:hypothetical protein
MRSISCTAAVGLLGIICLVLPGFSADVDLETGKILGICSYVDEQFGSAQTSVGPADLGALGIEPGDLLTIVFDELSLQVPYVYIPGDVPPGSLLAFQYGGNLYISVQNGNLVGEYHIAAGMSVRVEVLEKQGYAAELAVQHLERPTDRASYDTDEAYANFRMISCGMIARGVLYRSSHPASSDPRSEYAARLMEAVGVQTVVNVGETSDGLPSAYALNVTYRGLGDAGNVLAVNIGLVVESSAFREGVKQALEFITAHEPPFLIHCWEGKDRTGVLSAVLEALMGAPLEDVVSDYMATYENYYGIARGHQLYENTAALILEKLAEMGHGEAVTAANVNSVVEQYVLDDLGVSREVLSRLRATLSAD